MARVRISKFAARQGATLKCSKCGNEISKGESYKWFKPGFRSRYKVVRCMRRECEVRQSETMTSKMAGVVAAQEDAESALSALGTEDNTESLTSIMTDAAERIREVAEEYREAAEASPTGMIFGEDYNERADEIEQGADELDSWQPTEDEPDFDSCDEEHHDEDPEDEDAEIIERGAGHGCDSCDEILQTWWDQTVDEARDALGNLAF